MMFVETPTLGQGKLGNNMGKDNNMIKKNKYSMQEWQGLSYYATNMNLKLTKST